MKDKQQLPVVLIVDDEPESLAKQWARISAPSIEVITATNVSEVLKHLNESPPIDMLLTDVRLGDKDGDDGVELAKFMRKHYPDLPIVGYSQFERPDADSDNFRFLRGDDTETETLALEGLRSRALEHLNRTNGDYDSVFISYGGPDLRLASTINTFLKQNGIKTWFFAEDALPGQKLHRVMHDGVNSHDRVLLICSESSLVRNGVLNEIERVLEREANEGGADILIPISIDDFVFSRWEPVFRDIANQIRSRVIVTVPDADADDAEFVLAASKLVKVLKR